MIHAAEARKFLDSVEGKIGLLFHDDADGISSAALVLAYLRKRGVEARPVAFGDFEGIAEFASANFDRYIIVDIPPNEFLGDLKLVRNKPLLVVDHHPFEHDINGKNAIFVNPRLDDPNAYVSASHCIFDIIGKPKEWEWLMRVGATGDHEIEGTDEEAAAADVIGAVTAMKKAADFEKLAVFLSKCKKLDEFLYNE
ncbi:MAG: hypothetical protein QXD77_00185, partial [Candidatus Aenigmatarchaeota archaeon]